MVLLWRISNRYIPSVIKRQCNYDDEGLCKTYTDLVLFRYSRCDISCRSDHINPQEAEIGFYSRCSKACFEVRFKAGLLILIALLVKLVAVDHVVDGVVIVKNSSYFCII